MMGQNPDWRRIEKELIEICRSYGYALDQFDDVMAIINEPNQINLTELAKELADRLRP